MDQETFGPWLEKLTIRINELANAAFERNEDVVVTVALASFGNYSDTIRYAVLGPDGEHRGFKNNAAILLGAFTSLFEDLHD